MARRSLLSGVLFGAVTLAGCSDDGRHTTDAGVGIDGFLTSVDLAQPVKLPGGCGLIGTVNELSNLTGLHGYPSIARGGPGYEIGWVTAVPTTTQGAAQTYRIDVQLTDLNGAPIGPNVPMSDDPIAASDSPTVSPVTGGTSIAWTRQTGSATDIVLTTLDTNGQKLDASGASCQPNDSTCGITAVTTSGTAHSPVLERPFEDQRVSGPTQGQLGLAFVDTRNYTSCTAPDCTNGNDIFWKLIQTNGTELLFDKQLTMTTNARFASPRLAFDGFHQGVVWRDITTGLASDFYFTAIDNMGTEQAAPLKIGSSSGNNAQSTPDLLWDGTDYAIASATGSDATAAVIYQRQSTTGASALAARGVTFGGSDCQPSIAFDGVGYGVVYQMDCGTVGADLAFVRFDASGTRYALDGTSCGSSSDPACGVVLVTNASRTGGATKPTLVYGGQGEFAIAWMGGPDGLDFSDATSLDVYLQRVSCE